MAATRERLTPVEQRRGAIRRALEAGLHHRVHRLRLGRYFVPSLSRAPSVVHTVTHDTDPDVLACTCEARAHVACVHRAAVYLAKLEARGLRPVLPRAGSGTAQLAA